MLPVKSFKRGKSPYGVVNMSGNAMEWTTSWYLPYSGNNMVNKNLGTQYRVLRGGAWCSNRRGIKVTARDIGGISNFSKDYIAGFRCLKDISPLDSK